MADRGSIVRRHPTWMNALLVFTAPVLVGWAAKATELAIARPVATVTDACGRGLGGIVRAMVFWRVGRILEEA